MLPIQLLYISRLHYNCSTQNDADSQHLLGSLLFTGDFPPALSKVQLSAYPSFIERPSPSLLILPNKTLGLSYLLKAASQKHLQACLLAAQILYDGVQVPENKHLAKQLLNNIPESVQAHNLLAKWAEKERVKFHHFLASAKLGDVGSMVLTASCNMSGYGTEIDVDRGVEWYEKAFEGGDASVATLLSRYFLSQMEHDVDASEKAYLYTNHAAKMGDFISLVALATAHHPETTKYELWKCGRSWKRCIEIYCSDPRGIDFAAGILYGRWLERSSLRELGISQDLFDRLYASLVERVEGFGGQELIVGLKECYELEMAKEEIDDRYVSVRRGEGSTDEYVGTIDGAEKGKIDEIDLIETIDRKQQAVESKENDEEVIQAKANVSIQRNAGIAKETIRPNDIRASEIEYTQQTEIAIETVSMAPGIPVMVERNRLLSTILKCCSKVPGRQASLKSVREVAQNITDLFN